MIVKDFYNTCKEYKDFQIWEVKNMNDFMKGNQVLNQIFQDSYNTTYLNYSNDSSLVTGSPKEIITHLLEQVGDKHFFVFNWHDDNHAEVVSMQDHKLMNWGMDINNINEAYVYVVIMDKIKQPML